MIQSFELVTDAKLYTDDCNLQMSDVKYVMPFFHHRDSFWRSSRFLTVSCGHSFMCIDTDGAIPDDECGLRQIDT